MKQIFYDPQRKRWKRLRRVLDLSAVALTVVLAVFIFSVWKRQSLPELLLPSQKRNYKALKPPELRKTAQRPARRKTHRPASEIPFNTDEGLRAAFYVNDEPSYSSLKAHIHQIDLLFPDWLHVTRPDGRLQGATSLFPVRVYDVVDSTGVHGVDEQNKVARVIAAAKEDTEIFPMLNDYDMIAGTWNGDAIGKMLENAAAREALHVQLDKFLAANPSYRGICLDFEAVPEKDRKLYADWVAELYNDFKAKNLRIYVNVEVSAPDSLLKALGKGSDGIILMNYDQHETTSAPGPIAAESWFEGNLMRVLRLVPKDKIICAIGNYGYDWSVPLPEKEKKSSEKVLNAEDLTVQEVWQRAAESDADVHLEGDELNPHFVYDDEDEHVRHQVWFLDGVTALNELRAARSMGLKTFALWALGKEDGSLWSVWDHPSAKDAPQLLKDVPPGNDVNTEGEGDILRIVARPQRGTRTISMDADNFTITDE